MSHNLLDATSENVDLLILENGALFSDIRKECLTECSNLFDTHEATLVEKDCAFNCFKKYGTAYRNLTKIASGKNDYKEYVNSFIKYVKKGSKPFSEADQQKLQEDQEKDEKMRYGGVMRDYSKKNSYYF